MLKIEPPNYIFCPFCGEKLTTKKVEGQNFKYCLKDDWIYYPAVFQSANAIIIKDGKILLSQRGREPYKGKWMFPAGFLNFGEHPEEAVLREVKEETGLTAKNPKFYDVIQTKDDPRAMGNLAFFYKVNVEGNLINGDGEENLAVKWFDVGKYPDLAWHSHRDILKKLQRT